MTKEEKDSIKKAKMAKLRAKRPYAAQKLREKEERRAAKEAKKHGRVYVPPPTSRKKSRLPFKIRAVSLRRRNARA